VISAAIKRITTHSVGFSIGTILTQAMGFFLIPIYTRFLTPADYGILSIASVVSAIFSILFFLGMRSAISRFYFDYNQDAKELKEYLSTITLTVLAVSISLTFLVFVFGKTFFSVISPEVPFYPYIFLVFLTAIFSIPINIAFIVIQVREQSFTYSLINILKFLLTTSAIILFVVFFHEGALGSLLGQCIIAGIFFFVGITLLKKDIGFIFIADKLKESLTFGIFLMPHELASWTTNLIDRLFLSSYTTLTMVGVYSLGYQFATILSVITTAINFAWVPFFMSTFQETGDQAKPVIAQLTRYYVIVLMFFALGITFFSKDVVLLITNPDYYPAISVIPIIVLAFVFDGLYYMVVTQLFMVKKTGYITISTVSAALLNIILNFLLIPHYGMMGAAVSTVISFGFSFCLVFYFSHTHFPIPYDYSRIGATILLGVIIFILSLGIPDGGIMADIILKSGLIGLYLICLVLFGILTRNEVFKILEYGINQINHVRLKKN
jgi:O-antigen/teichoic acid export membrane protein